MAASIDPPSVLVKRYANRRLYNTVAAGYVTPAQLRDMVAAGIAVVVRDAVTGADITGVVLTDRGLLH